LIPCISFDPFINIEVEDLIIISNLIEEVKIAPLNDSITGEAIVIKELNNNLPGVYTYGGYNRTPNRRSDLDISINPYTPRGTHLVDDVPTTGLRIIDAITPGLIQINDLRDIVVERRNNLYSSSLPNIQQPVFGTTVEYSTSDFNLDLLAEDRVCDLVSDSSINRGTVRTRIGRSSLNNTSSTGFEVRDLHFSSNTAPPALARIYRFNGDELVANLVQTPASIIHGCGFSPIANTVGNSNIERFMFYRGVLNTGEAFASPRDISLRNFNSSIVYSSINELVPPDDDDLLLTTRRVTFGSIEDII